MKLEGTFTVMPPADLIQWARSAQKTGLLKLYNPAGKTIEVAFLDGRIVYSASDSPREKYGRWLVHLKLCTEADIRWARDRSQESNAGLGALLVSGGRLPETLALATLIQKTIEDLCDVFLWRDGAFSFKPVPMEKGQFLPIDLDPIRIVNQGLQRARIWNKLIAIIHPRIVFERTGLAFPSDPKGFDDKVIAQNVLLEVDDVRMVDEVIERLPFSRYKTTLALWQLQKHQLIERGDATEFGHRENRLDTLLVQARDARERGIAGPSRSRSWRAWSTPIPAGRSCPSSSSRRCRSFSSRSTSTISSPRTCRW